MSLPIEYPIVCPFCNELAYRKKGTMRIALPHKIYTRRECVMGHKFYSVDEVPENQAEIVAEIREIRKDAREWRNGLKHSKK